MIVLQLLVGFGILPLGFMAILLPYWMFFFAAMIGRGIAEANAEYDKEKWDGVSPWRNL